MYKIATKAICLIILEKLGTCTKLYKIELLLHLNVLVFRLKCNRYALCKGNIQ